MEFNDFVAGKGGSPIKTTKIIGHFFHFHLTDSWNDLIFKIFLWQHPSYFLCEGQGLSEKCERVAFLTFSILLEGTEVKLCPLEMPEWPWWEPSGSMIPLQIDLWCHSIKGWGTFPCAPTNYGRWRAECKASSLLSWMAHTSSSSLGMCPESDGFFFLLFLLFSQVLLSYIWKVVDVEP